MPSAPSPPVAADQLATRLTLKNRFGEAHHPPQRPYLHHLPKRDIICNLHLCVICVAIMVPGHFEVEKSEKISSQIFTIL